MGRTAANDRVIPSSHTNLWPRTSAILPKTGSKTPPLAGIPSGRYDALFCLRTWGANLFAGLTNNPRPVAPDGLQPKALAAS